ncbi:YjjG family noncanonical pyrimidine nucleotidase [Halosquirtibacter laminarini]|uniref:YjjG family noncanonical pyrimidine nucleotidase n=1 Tax=Halosquirtibacter laminarini TaxID=3374600 RepID=A0AC61NML7_9BACT|nr:YjjG family noncanonical pyrimidine nucleotidase [Prolixibacteraceae bacterium]
MKRFKMVQTLLIDLDHTLWDFESNSKVALMQAMDHMNIFDWVDDYDLFFEEYEKINKRYWGLYRQRQIDKDKLIVGRFEDTFEMVLPKAKGLGLKLNDTYLEFMPLQNKLMPGALEFLEYAKGRYTIVVVTNGFKSVQRKKMYTSKIDQFIDHVVISEEVGAPKPSPKIFQRALSCANSSKINALMIGDSLEADVQGGVDFGIKTIYFGDKENVPSTLKDSPFLIDSTDDWGQIRRILQPS